MSGSATLTMNRSRLASTTPAHTITSTIAGDASARRRQLGGELHVGPPVRAVSPSARHRRAAHEAGLDDKSQHTLSHWLRRSKVSILCRDGRDTRADGRPNPRSAWDAERCSTGQGARGGEAHARRSCCCARPSTGPSASTTSPRASGSDPVAAARLAAGRARPARPRAVPRARAADALRVSPQRDGRRSVPGAGGADAVGRSLAGEEGPPVQVRHKTCGAVVHAELRCECGHDVALGELELARPER